MAFDFTIAIEVGMVLAEFLFMHRMVSVVAIDADVWLDHEDGIGRKKRGYRYRSARKLTVARPVG